MYLINIEIKSNNNNNKSFATILMLTYQNFSAENLTSRRLNHTAAAAKSYISNDYCSQNWISCPHCFKTDE